MSILLRRTARFGDGLSYQDRETLRAVVRKVGRQKGYLTMEQSHSNRWVDNLIDALGPVVQEKLLRRRLERDGEA